MSVRITGRHMEITDEIRRYIDKKLARLERYMERAQSVEVILEQHHGYEYKAELLVKDGPVSITAKTKDVELTRAIDTLIDKAEHQLKKKWEKVRGATKKQKSRGALKRTSGLETSEAELVEQEGELDGAVAVATRRRSRVARRAMPVTIEKLDLQIFPAERVTPPTLTLEEAAEELFFEDENFLVFRENDSGQLQILYRRKDGNFGLLEPVVE